MFVVKTVRVDIAILSVEWCLAVLECIRHARKTSSESESCARKVRSVYADRHARKAGSGETSCTVVSGVPESAGNADRHAREYNVCCSLGTALIRKMQTCSWWNVSR